MYTLLALLIFELILVAHEFGHFVVAKHYGLTIHEFAIGVGPTLFKNKKGDTTYMLKLFPIGGYNMIDDKQLDEAPLKVQNAVYFAGAGFNFLTALVAFCIIAAMNGNNPFRDFEWTVIRVFQAFYMMFTGQFASEDLGGYVAMVSAMSDVIAQPTVIETISRVLKIFAVMGIYIGIFNLIPIYPLDGGQILVKSINSIKPDFFKPKMLNAMALVVFGLLFGINILLTFKDVVTMWR